MLDCILTGEDLAHGALDALAPVACAKRAQHRPGAIRLGGIEEAAREAILTRAADFSSLNVMLVPERLSVADIRFIAFDMDGTLVVNECIDDMARLGGREKEVAALTAQAMAGKADFAESLRSRVAALKGLASDAIDAAVRAIELQPGAKYLLDFCARYGMRTAILSGGFPEFTSRVADTLGIDYCVSNELVRDALGALTGEVTGPAGGKLFDADGKRRALEVLAQTQGLPLSATMAVGDGANDVQMLAAAGLSVAYHAKPVAISAASCAIRTGGLDTIALLFAESW